MAILKRGIFRSTALCWCHRTSQSAAGLISLKSIGTYQDN